MFSPDQLDALMKEAMAELDKQDNSKGQGRTRRNNGSTGKLNLTPAQALIIIGFLTGTLTVFSVLVDANQLVSIVLQGSLKSDTKNAQKNELDNLLAQLGDKSFDDVLKAMLKRIT
ncbi:MAG: hypothetical protein ACOYVK_00790 [Bacillota bacterium]